MDRISVIELTEENILKYGLCGYKSLKRPGFPEKVNWFRTQQKNGLKIKALVTENDNTQGMVETIPGEFAWRPVHAKGYLFIHCLFVGFERKYKGRGYASSLIAACVQDAENQNMKGVAVITRKGSFMADQSIFLKNGFEVVDKTVPDFELLVRRFDQSFPDPKFPANWEERLLPYQKGLTVIRGYPCPHTVKNVDEIVGVAEDEFKIMPKVITLQNAEEAQNCPFGIFCIVFEREIISHHPISSKRFLNIMRQLIPQKVQ